MRIAAKTRILLIGAVATALAAGAIATAAPAQAADWNIPWRSIHYPFYPECTTHMNPFEPGYGTQVCKGYYVVNRRNYKFTQDNTHVCPALGKVQRITLDYVLNPTGGGVTSARTLAGFSMRW